MGDASDDWLAALNGALAVGQPLASDVTEINRALEHIVGLLKGASSLLELGNAPLAAFLAITALEETSKVHVGIYRRSEVPTKRHEDPLFSHKKKHHLAAAPTVAMGTRLQSAIGEDRMHELCQQARSGALVRLRESSLYIERPEGALRIPAEIVSSALARELLLFSVEAFDDALVGYTNHSYVLGEQTDEIFSKWKAT